MHAKPESSEARWTGFDALPRAHGRPLGSGRIRSVPADFLVDEALGLAPDGEGEHLLLRVRKTDANTEWVARRLAAAAGCPVRDLGYAGLKDRHAVTTQWFSLPRPTQGLPDWAPLAADGIEVLEAHPHRRKLRRGALAGNRFRILIRDLGVSEPDLDQRVHAIRARGVPNWFGEQRFGRNGSNLARAQAMFTGAIRRPSRHQRSLWLSAARSQLFNEVLAARVTSGDWDVPKDGDCMNLAGSRSIFLVERVDETIGSRSRAFDIHPTGPLWGRGEPPTAGAVLELEQSIAACFPAWTDGLARAGMDQERRPLRLVVPSLEWSRTGDGVVLTFDLPAGCYATAVLRELIDWSDREA
jgi:tRNA pseudouridine13 synthase